MYRIIQFNLKQDVTEQTLNEPSDPLPDKRLNFAAIHMTLSQASVWVRNQLTITS